MTPLSTDDLEVIRSGGVGMSRPVPFNGNLKPADDFSLGEAVRFASFFHARSYSAAIDVFLNAKLFGFVRYSARHEKVLPERYSLSRTGNRSRKTVIVRAGEMGYFKCVIGDYDLSDKEGRQSTFKITEAFSREFAGSLKIDLVPAETIRLQRKVGDRKIIVDYADTPVIEQWRRDVERFNVHNQQFEWTLDGDRLSSDVYRVYYDKEGHESFTEYAGGGRFYGEITNVPKKEKPKILIDGEPTAVADYKALHPMMAYSLNKVSYLDIRPDNPDPYRVTPGTSEIEREVNKLLFLCSLNASSGRSAIAATRNKINELVDKGEMKPEASEVQLSSSYRKLVAHHHMISNWISSGMGRYFHWLDSRLINDVMQRCTERGIPFFGIHDAILTKQRYIGTVVSIMESVYLNQYNHKIIVDVSQKKKKRRRGN